MLGAIARLIGSKQQRKQEMEYGVRSAVLGTPGTLLFCWLHNTIQRSTVHASYSVVQASQLFLQDYAASRAGHVQPVIFPSSLPGRQGGEP